MNRKEWINNFVANNNRKPSSQEVKKALVLEEFTATFWDKLIIHWFVVITSMVAIVGVAFLFINNRILESDLKEKEVNTLVEKSSIEATTTTITTTQATTTVTLHSSSSWNDHQASALAQAMVRFGDEMKQPGYVKVDTPIRLHFQSEKIFDGYKVLESYQYQNGSTTHRYFFVLTPMGVPEVLYSTGDTNVKPTENELIPKLFNAIYYGSTANLSIESNYKQDLIAIMNLNDMATGDYLSITGIWQNKEGHKIAFDYEGNIIYNPTSMALSEDNLGVPLTNFTINNDGSAFAYATYRDISFFPAGVVVAGGENSETYRDRIALRSDMRDPKVYYRVSDFSY